MKKYKVYVIEKWERAVELEATDPQSALRLVEECHNDSKPEIDMYIHEPNYLNDEPVEFWEVYSQAKDGTWSNEEIVPPNRSWWAGLSVLQKITMSICFAGIAASAIMIGCLIYWIFFDPQYSWFWN